ncbi:MarR family transcriptional regulator [Nocardioides zeae]|uniref:MarR family transcriptional regulator n=1 Tax=Nocardioides imazamoxiresistens TaxID=3231893 RepID=A0ABU3PSJ4_9ACTN|nr:MarR family transcriptional regulator [Nocardioides zeae]MDT9592177.1 MarR family transcriptional regulator [Nocardioides zeae]
MTEQAESDEQLARSETLGREWTRVRRRRVVFPESLLEESAFRLLLHLDDHGPRTLTSLAEQMEVELSTVSRQMTALVRQGLAHRVLADDGARLVEPTTDGLAALTHDRRLRARVWGDAMAEMGAERLDAMLVLLGDFNDALDRATARARAADPPTA